MGVSEGGYDLRYAFELARAAEPTKFVTFPVFPMSMQQVDRMAAASVPNLAGADRTTYMRGVCPDVVFAFDGLTLAQVELLRAFPLSFTDVYILRVPRSEQVTAQDSIAYTVAGVHYCNLLESSYTLASKRSVDNGGATLFSDFSVRDHWIYQINRTTPAGFEHFASYDDTNQRCVLAALNPPANGARVSVNYKATAWLARAKPMTWSPVPMRSDLFTAQLRFDAV